jgi:uncharacterized protein (DUF736 family)
MTENKQNNEWGEREIGALWVNVKQSDGSKYLTGTINGQKVVLFKNKSHSENDKAPYFRVYKHQERDASSSTSEQQVEEVAEPDLI